MVVALRHLRTLKTIEGLSLYEILDFTGGKKYSQSIFPRCLFHTAREVMNDGPEL